MDFFDKARQDNARRQQRIQELVTNSKASTWKSRYGDFVVVGLDPHNRSQWRATAIDESGEPKYHFVATDHPGALRHAYTMGVDLFGQPIQLIPGQPEVKKAEHDDLVAAATAALDNSLRKPQYRNSPNPLTGHCYATSEALYHLMGGQESGWVPQNIQHEGDQHWYLRHSKTGAILDPTAGQFRTPVPYEKGRGRGFLTKQPSKRAQVIIDRVNQANAKLTKGIGTSLALMGALATGQVQDQPEPKPSAKFLQAVQRAGIDTQPQKWTPEGLHQSLFPIAHLESSFGQNVNHAKHPKGEYHTAFGAVGLKPVTAHEEYLRTPTLQKLYGDLQDPADFTRKLKADPKFYNLVASAHFLRLQKIHGSAEKAAYAWRWGTTAASGAPDEQVQNEVYVQKYRHLAAQSGLKKMAIRDLRPADTMTEIPANGPLGPFKKEIWDYGHLIKSPILRQKYNIEVHVQHGGRDTTGNGYVKARLVHRGDPHSRVLGTVEGVHSKHHRAVGIEFTELEKALHGHGLGKALYEAFYAHAYHRLGVEQVVGSSHSSMAHKVHTAITQEHGLQGYNPREKPPAAGRYGPFDEAYGPYQYTLKSEHEELQKMAIKDIKPGEQLRAEGGMVRNDYSHLIKSPILKQNYQLFAQHHPEYPELMQVRIVDRRTGDRVGHIDGGLTRDSWDNNAVEPAHVEIKDKKLLGKGLGKAMYEALYAHAFHHLQVRHVAGDVHSTNAHRTHLSVAKEHGLQGYDPDRINPERGAFDSAYGPYEYKLK